MQDDNRAQRWMSIIRTKWCQFSYIRNYSCMHKIWAARQARHDHQHLVVVEKRVLHRLDHPDVLCIMCSIGEEVRAVSLLGTNSNLIKNSPTQKKMHQ